MVRYWPRRDHLLFFGPLLPLPALAVLDLLDGKQQTVVHQFVLAEQLDVLLDLFLDSLNVRLVEPQEIESLTLSHFLDTLQVDILQCARVLRLGRDNDIPIDNGALEVEDVDYVLCGLMLDRIGHQHEVYGHYVLHLNFKHSVYSTDETVSIFLYVAEVLWEGSQEHPQLVIVHRLDDELVVVRKEEEAAGLALALTRLEHLITITLGRQRVLDADLVNVIHLAHILELFGRVLEDCHLLIDSQHRLVSALIFGDGLDGGIDGRRPHLRLYKQVIDEIFCLSAVPLLRILDLDSVQATNTHELVVFLLFLLDAVVRVHALTIFTLKVVHAYVGKLLDALEDDVHELHVE